MSANNQTDAFRQSLDLIQLRKTDGSWRRHSAWQLTCWCDADNKSDLYVAGLWLWVCLWRRCGEL